MVQIYEDSETKKLIEQLRKEDPSINLSDIFKTAIQRFKDDRLGEEQDRLVKLSKMLEKSRFEKLKINEEIEYIENQIVIEQKKLCELLEKDKEKKQNLESLKLIRIKDTISNINFFYKIEDQTLVSKFAKDYVENYWVEITIVDYMDIKGYSKQEIKK